jgi:polyhydroxybutyrate depolymerase
MRFPGWLASVLAALVLLPACGGGKASTSGAAEAPLAAATTASTPIASTPRPAVTGSGCSAPLPAAFAAGSTSTHALTSGALERTYRVHLPPGYDNREPLPLVLNYHGLGGTALEQEFYSGLLAVSDAEGFILVSPDASGSARSWASFVNIPNGTDDVLFTNALLDALITELCVDQDRVYATGMSNGGFMSSRLGCVLPDRFAAVAPVAGVYFPALETCGSATPIIAFHGTADGTVPFERGRLLGVIPYDGVRASLAAWAKHNGCGNAAAPRNLRGSVALETFADCDADTQLYVINGGGHTWPGAMPIASLGPTTPDIDAAELMWAFFEAHPRKR